MSTEKDREVVQARVNEVEARVDRAVAEDVAVGMAAQADAERARADALAASNVRKDMHAREARSERDAAYVSSAVNAEAARSSSFGFWMLAGLVAVGLLIAAIWFANRPEPSSTVIAVNRPPATAPATPAPQPIPQAATPPPPPPVVIDRPVPVDRPVAVPGPVERPAPPRQPNQTIIVQPGAPAGEAPRSEAPAETPAESPPATETAPAPPGGSGQ